METGWNVLDAVLLGAFALALLRGFRQGALSQVAAFGGAAIGLVAGAVWAPPIASMFLDAPSRGLALLTVAILMAAILIGQGIGFAVGLRLRHAAEVAGVGVLDRAVGVLVGAAGVLVVVWLAASLLAQGPVPSVAHHVRASRVVATIDDVLPPAPDVFGRVGNYLDAQGFPQVFSGMQGGITAPPVPPTSDEAVRSAALLGQPSTVQVQAIGCGGISSGSGFVTRPGIVVSNAHVVAGGEEILVRDTAGERPAAVIHIDPALDLAVLAVPGLEAPALGWAAEPAERATEGVTLGFPGGQRDMVVRPATVRSRGANPRP